MCGNKCNVLSLASKAKGVCVCVRVGGDMEWGSGVFIVKKKKKARGR